MELIICIKMDLALNNLIKLIYYKNQQTKESWTEHIILTPRVDCSNCS